MPDNIAPEVEPIDAMQAASEAELQAPATAEDDEAAEGAAPAAAAEGSPDELIVTIGDEVAPEEDERTAPTWVKDLRKQNRELVRQTRDLEARLSQAQPVQAAVVVGAKPTLAAVDYDEDKYAAELEAWHERKSHAAEREREAQRQQEAQAADWQKRIGTYKAQAIALRVPHFEQAEEVVKDAFNTVQQGLIIKACKQPALMVAALGNNERKARELAAISDPVEFVAEIVRTEAQLKTQSRKPATKPEAPAPRSSMSGASAVDNVLSKLQAQAEKTGDRTPVVRYLQGKAKQAA